MSKKRRGRKKKNILLKFFIVIFLILVCLKFVRLNYFKPMIEEKVSQAIELPFKINGDVKLGMAGIYPAISLGDIVLNNRRLGGYKIAVNPFVVGVSIPKIKGYKDNAIITADIKYVLGEFVFNAYAKNVAYSEISENIDGNFDLKINLKGQGDDFNKVKSTMQGKILLLGEEGKLRSAALKLWGADLFTSMLAGIAGKTNKLKLNCAVADINVDKGIASVKRSAIDTDEVAIDIKGSVDIANEALRLKLTPRPKIPSLVNLATPVDVLGTISNPKIKADKKAVAKKVGGAILQAANPVFLVTSIVADAIVEDEGKENINICKEYLN